MLFKPWNVSILCCSCCTLFAAASVNAATYQCLACPPGTYSSGGAEGASSCKTCEANYYCPGGSDRKACPSGYACPEGTVNLEDQIAKKVLCSAGTFLTGTTCAICPANNYCIGGSHKEPCPAGQTSPEGSTSSIQCKVPCVNTQRPTRDQAFTSPRGLTQGYCHTSSLGCNMTQYCANSTSQSWNGKTWEGSYHGVPGGGTYCFCRTKSYGTNQCGAWSSWVYYLYNADASECAYVCSDWCASGVANWSGAVQW